MKLTLLLPTRITFYKINLSNNFLIHHSFIFPWHWWITLTIIKPFSSTERNLFSGFPFSIMRNDFHRQIRELPKNRYIRFVTLQLITLTNVYQEWLDLGYWIIVMKYHLTTFYWILTNHFNQLINLLLSHKVIVLLYSCMNYKRVISLCKIGITCPNYRN